MADLVWLHEEALRLTHPVFAAGGPDAATIFISVSYTHLTLPTNREV